MEHSIGIKEKHKKLWALGFIATPIMETSVSRKLIAKALTSCFQLYHSLKVITIKNLEAVIILRFTNE